jgi:hypothetical protein
MTEIYGCNYNIVLVLLVVACDRCLPVFLVTFFD